MNEVLKNAGQNGETNKANPLQELSDANLLGIIRGATVDPTAAENAAEVLGRRLEARALTEERVRGLIDASARNYSFRDALRYVQKIQEGKLTFEAVENLFRSRSDSTELESKQPAHLLNRKSNKNR